MRLIERSRPLLPPAAGPKIAEHGVARHRERDIAEDLLAAIGQRVWLDVDFGVHMRRVRAWGNGLSRLNSSHAEFKHT